MDKLIRAGFTVSATKYGLFETEITFLGHKMDQTGVSALLRLIDAILKYWLEVIHLVRNCRYSKYNSLSFICSVIINYIDWPCHSSSG
jgi:hypothetical protein